MHRLLAGTVAVVFVVTGCGGSGDSSTAVASLSESETTLPASEDDAEVDPEQAALDLTECLRRHGVEIADPTVDADGDVQLGQPQIADGQNPRDVMRPAFEACSAEVEGISLGFGRPDDTEFQDTLLEFAACMRDQGVDMPDPDFSDSGPPDGDGESGERGAGGGPFGAFDEDDPAFEAALGACEDILAGSGPGGGRFGGGPAGGGDDG
ncbi:MAG TPA: hypothetical protein VLG28_01960 [Acidimicrobiia bacterium]|jgi:hypothetical protein|nr:hypothetical protein [Acidimicrobiia bacterium]